METIHCDRCGQDKEGSVDLYFSSGCYVVYGLSYWTKFSRPGENIICDDCMWEEEEYIAEFGDNRSRGVNGNTTTL